MLGRVKDRFFVCLHENRGCDPHPSRCSKKKREDFSHFTGSIYIGN